MPAPGALAIVGDFATVCISFFVCLFFFLFWWLSLFFFVRFFFVFFFFLFLADVLVRSVAPKGTPHGIRNKTNEKVTSDAVPTARSAQKRRIVFKHGHCTHGCQIVDMSDTGAKLMHDDILLFRRNSCSSLRLANPAIVR